MSDNPEWKPVDALRRFQDAGKRRSIRTDSGKTRRLPALPYEYWLKPSGNVVRVAMMTTRNVSEAVDPQRYMDFNRRRILRAGWVPWNWNEVRAYAPHVAAGCTSEADWHKKRDELQVQRRTEYQKVADANSAWLDQAKTRKAETAEAIADFVKEFTNVMKSNESKVKKIG